MKYIKIFLIILALVATLSGCKSINNEVVKEDLVIEEVEESSRETEKKKSDSQEIRDAIEKALEKESNDESTEEDIDEDLIEEELIEDGTIEEESVGDITTGESQDLETEEEFEDTEDQSVLDNIQKEIDALIEDIKQGNVIPDDHENYSVLP